MGSCLSCLTHWGRGKMTAIFQTTSSNAFSWMKVYEFRSRFHWSWFLRVQLTIFQHWFRNWLGADQATSHFLNQCWFVYWRIYASLGLNELRVNFPTLAPLAHVYWLLQWPIREGQVSRIKCQLDSGGPKVKNNKWCVIRFGTSIMVTRWCLTRCVLVTPYGDQDLCQHWLR